MALIVSGNEGRINTGEVQTLYICYRTLFDGQSTILAMKMKRGTGSAIRRSVVVRSTLHDSRSWRPVRELWPDTALKKQKVGETTAGESNDLR